MTLPKVLPLNPEQKLCKLFMLISAVTLLIVENIFYVYKTDVQQSLIL